MTRLHFIASNYYFTTILTSITSLYMGVKNCYNLLSQFESFDML